MGGGICASDGAVGEGATAGGGGGGGGGGNCPIGGTPEATEVEGERESGLGD
ncbi:hypothetical protein EV356DRAFT_505926 [Viridothelium virens]|uniref:Uncharacterized protein n=1 Tax=Viridothelium virens TaxID=1048519 RepID=A0A6A6HKF4_VIRVR|nr:hypothetical protein EV356DRAFT_505926 [Viridothelium virens]